MTSSITIKWNTLSIDDWEKRFSQISRSNILQSYIYARAACPLHKQKARWGLIFADGREAGLVQILEAGMLWNLFHAIILDRGPLWFDGFGTPMQIKNFFAEMNKQFPARRGRKRRVLPEIEDGAAARKIVAQAGFNPVNGEAGYQTIWLDITSLPDVLRAGMKSNWRNKLGKAEKAGLSIEWDTGIEHLPWILTEYALDKHQRAYGGPSPEFVKAYAPFLAAQGDLLIGRAMKDGAPVAFVLFACHGRAATYLIGWSSTQGRDMAAHHLLLWDGVQHLKEKGIAELDMGGFNGDGAEGIRVFKEGMGGQIVRYLGRHT